MGSGNAILETWSKGQAVELPGQTRTSDGLPDTEGPNFIVLTRIQVLTDLAQFWYGGDNPDNLIPTSAGIRLDIGNANVIRNIVTTTSTAPQTPPYSSLNRTIFSRGLMGPKTQLTTNDLAVQYPRYNQYVTETGQQANILEFATRTVVNSLPFTGQTQSGYRWLTEPKHDCISYILTPEDWLGVYAILPSGTGTITEPNGPVSLSGMWVNIEGYFSPQFEDIIPYIR